MKNIHAGFIGLGNMGAAMTERLIAKNLTLHVYDVNVDAMQPFVDKGAIAHSSPKSLSDHAQIVFACLPTPTISREVAYGSNGVIHGSKIEIYLETSTIGRATINDIANQLTRKNIETIDAPITGGPPRARDGSLVIMVSGQDQAIVQARPLLNLIAGSVKVVGDRPGQGQLMKLVNNILLASNMIVAAEAFALGKKGGLSIDTMLDLLRTGTGFSTAGCEILGPSIASQKFDFGAAMSILEKDILAGLTEADALKVTLPTIKKASETWVDACRAGFENEDFTQIANFVETKRNQT